MGQAKKRRATKPTVVPTPGSGFGQQLGSEEAVRLFDEQGASAMFLPFSEFMRSTKMSWPEMRAELESGRLRSSRLVNRDDGREMPIVRGDAMLAWMAKTGFKFPTTN